MGDAKRINGNMHSWGSIVLKIGNERYTGATGIDYGDKRERVKGYGTGRSHAPRGRSSGKYTTDPVKVTVAKGSAEEIRRMLALLAPDGVSIGDVAFPITVAFFEDGDVPMSVLIEDCVLITDQSSHAEGADPLSDTLEFDCMRIWRNGKALFNATEGF
jgi:hypothetical protein